MSTRKRTLGLRQLREAQGLKLRETARLADLDASHLSRVERGQKRLSMAALGRLAPVIGLGPAELAGLLAAEAQRSRTAGTEAP